MNNEDKSLIKDCILALEALASLTIILGFKLTTLKLISLIKRLENLIKSK